MKHPLICFDFAFLKTEGEVEGETDEDFVTNLVCVDCDTGFPRNISCPSKEASNYTAQGVVKFIKSLYTITSVA